jgi:hypothetical protein
MAWKFTHDGHVYKEGDVTVDQWGDICDLAGADWTVINPLRSPRYAKAIFSVVVSGHTGQDREAAAKTIGAMTTDQFLALFTDNDEGDDLPREFEDGIPQ